MAKEQKETKKADFEAFFKIYPKASRLYAVVIQGAYVVFETHLEALQHQKAIASRNVTSVIEVLEK